MIKLVCILFLMYGFTLTGQNLEKYLKRDSLTTTGGDALVHEGAIYLIKGKKANLSVNNSFDPIIYQMDYSLNLLDSLRLSGIISPTPSAVNAFFTKITSVGTDSLAVTFGVFENSTTISRYFVVFLNSSLDVLSSFSLNDVGDSLVYYILNCKEYNNTLLLSGALGNNTPNVTDGFLAQFDYEGNKLNEVIIPVDTFLQLPFPIPFPKLSIGDFYPVPDGFLVSFYPYQLSLNMGFIDTAFTLNRLMYVKDTASNYGHQLEQNIQFIENQANEPKLVTQTASYLDTLFLPPDTVGYTYYYRNLSMVSLNSNYEFDKIDTFAYSKNKIFDTIYTEVTTFDYGMFAVNNAKDSAMIMATDMEPSPFYYLKPNNTTYITCFNPNTGQTNWSKVYSNGYAHNGQEVLSLPDNKWLLVFDEYNWDKFGENSLAIHLIIIDGKGNPIGINEDEEKALGQEPFIFPNPAKDQLTVGALHWPGNVYNYQLTDLKGALVQKGVLPVSGKINLLEILKGVYVLSITNQTGFGWARKVIID